MVIRPGQQDRHDAGTRTGGTDRPGWIERQLVRRGVLDARVLDAFARVPRADFVPQAMRERAVVDAPIGIGCGQTVSQPYVVALALEALALRGGERVLDIGTGSGWQAALLSHLAGEVYTIEIHHTLLTAAKLAMQRHARAPIHARLGDGSLGWPEEAPFDAMVGGAFCTAPPPALLDQLAVGGRMVLPVGGKEVQSLFLYVKKGPTRNGEGSVERTLLERVRFVPLLGAQGSGRYPDDFPRPNRP